MTAHGVTVRVVDVLLVSVGIAIVPGIFTGGTIVTVTLTENEALSPSIAVTLTGYCPAVREGFLI